jgi:hypothetical protein
MSSLSTDVEGKTPESIIRDVVDPVVDQYDALLTARDGQGLVRFEREMLRGFAYWLVKGPPTP